MYTKHNPNKHTRTPTGVVHHIGVHYTTTTDGLRTTFVSTIVDTSNTTHLPPSTPCAPHPTTGSPPLGAPVGLGDVVQGVSGVVMVFDAPEHGATQSHVEGFVSRLEIVVGALPAGGPRVPVLVVTSSRITEQQLQVGGVGVGCFVGGRRVEGAGVVHVGAVVCIRLELVVYVYTRYMRTHMHTHINTSFTTHTHTGCIDAATQQPHCRITTQSLSHHALPTPATHIIITLITCQRTSHCCQHDCHHCQPECYYAYHFCQHDCHWYYATCQ